MENRNKSANLITKSHLNTRLAALTALLIMASFAPHNSWAGGTGKAAQQFGQAVSRLTASAPHQAQTTLMRLRLQNLPTRIAANRAQETQLFSGARQARLAARAAAPRTTKLATYTPGAGSILTNFLKRGPSASRLFSSNSMATYIDGYKWREIDIFKNLARQLGPEAKIASPLLVQATENIENILEKLPEQIHIAQKDAIDQSNNRWQNDMYRAIRMQDESPSAYQHQKQLDDTFRVQKLLLKLFPAEQESSNSFIRPYREYNLTSSLAGAYAREIEKITQANKPFTINTLVSQLEALYSEKQDIPIDSISGNNKYFIAILAESAHANPKATIENLVAYAALKASTIYDNPILFFASIGIASPDVQNFFDQEIKANEQRKKEYALQHLLRPMTLTELCLDPWEISKNKLERNILDEKLKNPNYANRNYDAEKEARQEALEQTAEEFKKYRLNGLWIASEQIKEN